MTDTPSLLLSDKTASQLLGISRATFWRRVSDKTLPPPIRLGGVTRWRRDELERAIATASARADRSMRGQ